VAPRLSLTAPAFRARLGYVGLYTAVGALFPYIPVYYSSLGLDLGAIGMLAAIFSAAGMLGSPLWGAAGDRLGGSRALLLIPATLAALAFGALALARAPLALGIAAATASFGMAGVGPVLDARALETVQDDRSRFGRLRVWGSISFIASALFVGWLIDRTGIRSLFIVLIAALLATGVIGLGLRSQSSEPALPRLGSLAAVFRSALLMRFMAAALVVWTANSAINAFFSVHLVQIGAPSTLVGWAWAVGAAVEVPLMIAFPVLSRRLGLERLIVIGAACFVARAAAVTLVTDPVLATFTMALHGAAFSLVLVGCVAYVSRHAPAGAAASAQGVLSAMIFGLSMIIGPELGGMLAGRLGLPGMFAIAGAGSAAGVIGLAWVLAPALGTARSSATVPEA
jgi:MFS transporter, PPP family, 3-phenylpropionic acid transporter